MNLEAVEKFEPFTFPNFCFRFIFFLHNSPLLNLKRNKKLWDDILESCKIFHSSQAPEASQQQSAAPLSPLK